MIFEIRKRQNLNLHLSSCERRNWMREESIKEIKLGGQVCRPAPLKVEFRKMLFPMPLLFLSGVFTGVGLMLALM